MRKTLKYLSKHKDIAVVRTELIRAHIMIMLLALVIISLLALGSMNVTFDPVLSGISVALLAIVAIISLAVAMAVARQKKL
jgi:predicted Co/Zn/Cd cation transporter (cation efflux family)